MIEEVPANLQNYALWEYNDYKLSKADSGSTGRHKEDGSRDYGLRRRVI